MAFAERNGRDRAASAAAVFLCHGVIALILISGLGFDPNRADRDQLAVFDVRSPPPAPPVEEVFPPSARASEPEGRAAPPNLKAAAAPVAAPEPEVRLETPPPVAAAPAPREGADRAAGAATVAGPGAGSGGAGPGSGSGSSGDGGGSGDGTGAGGAPVSRARLVAGNLSLADYPPALRRAGIGGRVEIHMTVEPTGGVGRCVVVQSSGNAELDATTCDLVRQRYRFSPARDSQGRAVPDLVGESHLWTSRRRGR